jgi:hypothetical protein
MAPPLIFGGIKKPGGAGGAGGIGGVGSRASIRLFPGLPRTILSRVGVGESRYGNNWSTRRCVIFGVLIVSLRRHFPKNGMTTPPLAENDFEQSRCRRVTLRK